MKVHLRSGLGCPSVFALDFWRKFSRSSTVTHALLMVGLILLPTSPGSADWVDTDSDSAPDSWASTLTGQVQSITDLDAVQQDIDGDGAYNLEELQHGSDPFSYDTDGDGMRDGDEIQLTSGLFSPLLWDSNGDGVSDHDAFYNFFGVTYPGGQLPSFPGASYSDADGDGTKNPFDPYPTDPLNNDSDSDGLDDSYDPALGDSNNWSTVNSNSWYGNALGDADFDNILNFWDAYPWDSNNGNYWDSDNDGIANESDPFPNDSSNYSFTNAITWGSDVNGDTDGDMVPNHSDSWPYDSLNGIPPIIVDTDADDDFIEDDLDPSIYDFSNYSAANGYSWYGFALQDDDVDGVCNFFDTHPYDTFDGLEDYDEDNVPNGDDPFPKDTTNYSNINSISWGADLFGDGDDDGMANWQDPLPSDTYNGLPDFDSDGIANETDPAPKDAANYSEINGTSWATNAFGDEDGDATQNWYDASPYPVEANTDGDGFPDAVDPFQNDANNYSSINGQSWYGNVLGNDDNDSYLNWEDPWPSDPSNGSNDTDSDGLNNDIDPAATDSSNYSYHNSTAWFGSALADNDNDGTVNFYDYDPNSGGNRDFDAYPDASDPAPDDYYNYSSVNYTSWYGEALNDNDGDLQSNFYDPTPYGEPPVDSDGDGLDVNEESAWETSDTDSDFDDDGLTDGEEVEIYSTSPTNPFSLSQSRGTGNLYTDWQLVDLTDADEGVGDGIPDRIETYFGLNTAWRGDAFLDKDQNGINNVTQYSMGIALDADLARYDTDLDGMSDVFEDYYELRKLDPTDAVKDADEDGVMNFEEMALLLSPQIADSTSIGGLGDLQVLMLSIRYPDGTVPPATDADENSIPDWADALLENPIAPDFTHFSRSSTTDLDGDGLPDRWEYQHSRFRHPALNGLNLRMDDAADDNDEDELTNETEFQIGTSPIAGDSDGDEINDGDEDADGDGLTNAQEAQHGTKAGIRDTDEDGVDDRQEIEDGTDPTDKDSNINTLLGLRVFTKLISA